MHSNSHLGITLAAMTHLAAATPNLNFACDTHYPWTNIDIIEGEPFRFVDGNLKVSGEPGLGVSIDRQKLRKLADLYESAGMNDRNDTLYMQQFDPTYERRVPRW
jgi:glucarate dehydratase